MVHPVVKLQLICSFIKV